jgi:uncharacterized protein YwgA
MNRTEFVLAGLYTDGREEFGPVQVQKLFFLIDKNIANLIGGPQFKFEPYNYGPFDREVYEELDRLLADGYLELCFVGSIRNYSISEKGREKAKELFNALDPSAKGFITKASNFVRNLSFQDLVRAIYKAYPEMREKSVFRG